MQGGLSYKLNKLAADNVFHQVDSVSVWLLHFAEDEHLESDESERSKGSLPVGTHHLGDLLRVLVLSCRRDFPHNVSASLEVRHG